MSCLCRSEEAEEEAKLRRAQKLRSKAIDDKIKRERDERRRTMNLLLLGRANVFSNSIMQHSL